MRCHFCTNPATVHLTDIIQQNKREWHLCESCARKHQFLTIPQNELQVPALLHFLMGQAVERLSNNALAEVVCPDCGLHYGLFRSQGRLGCPRDYDLFQIMLEPLLERIHRRTRHQGKIPARLLQAQKQIRLSSLQSQLEEAIAAENYELAVHLRDQIQQIELQDTKAPTDDGSIQGSNL